MSLGEINIASSICAKLSAHGSGGGLQLPALGALVLIPDKLPRRLQCRRGRERFLTPGQPKHLGNAIVAEGVPFAMPKELRYSFADGHEASVSHPWWSLTSPILLRPNMAFLNLTRKARQTPKAGRFIQMNHNRADLTIKSKTTRESTSPHSPAPPRGRPRASSGEHESSRSGPRWWLPACGPG